MNVFEFPQYFFYRVKISIVFSLNTYALIGWDLSIGESSFDCKPLQGNQGTKKRGQAKICFHMVNKSAMNFRGNHRELPLQYPANGFIFSRSGFTKDAEKYCEEKGIACSEDERWFAG
jgi:hypothetical protein